MASTYRSRIVLLFLVAASSLWRSQAGEPPTAVIAQGTAAPPVRELVVAPSRVAIKTTQTLAAQIIDASGKGCEPQPAFTWAGEAGRITRDGVFTAPDRIGSVRVTCAATDGSLQRDINVHVFDPADRFLKADGAVLRDSRGYGKEVQLRGANLGGWLEWQAWMCPMDTSKTLRDDNPGHNGYDFEVRKLLTNRFGATVAEELINVYEDAWISERDFDHIKALGFNVVRLTLAYDTMLNLDGTWRADAFKRMDWAVEQAWKSGIYTIVDYHAFLPPGADQNGSAGGYFSNEAQMAETVRIWARIAEHYKGNPAVAMYDLLNEPNNSQLKNQPAPKASVVCDLYDRLYTAIRATDPDHAIAMEGMWDWRSLRDPAKCGYQNVVYSFHWYNWGGKTTADRNKATDNDLRNVANMQKAWNVPCFVGEFNLFGDKDAWKYALQQYDATRLHWTMWTHKNTASGTNRWGVYTTIPGKAPPGPNLATDSADSIREKWKAWATTPETFALNPMFKPLLMPAAAK